MRHASPVGWAVLLGAAGLGVLRAGGAGGADAPRQAASDPPAGWPIPEIRVRQPAVTQATRELVQQLASNDFATREAASRELAARGLDAFPGLRQAVDASNDDEVRARTAGILLTGEFQLPGNLPDRVARVLGSYRARRLNHLSQITGEPDAAVLESILQPDDNASEKRELFFHIVTQLETDPHWRGLINQAAARQGSYRARLAIAAGNLDEAEQILREDAPTLPGARADYAALVGMRKGRSLAPWEELLKPGINAVTLRPEMGLLLHRAAGNLPRAADFASDTANAALTPARAVLLDARRYGALAHLGEVARIRDHTELESALPFALSGDTQHADELLNRAIAQAQHDGLSARTARLLLLNGKADVVIATRKEAAARDLAFPLLCAQLRIRDALAALPDPKNTPIQYVRQLRELGLTAAARKVLLAIKPDEDKLAESLAQYEFDYATELQLAGISTAAGWRNRALLTAEWYDQQSRILDVKTAELDRTTDDLEIKTADAAAKEAGDPQADGPGGAATIPIVRCAGPDALAAAQAALAQARALQTQSALQAQLIARRAQLDAEQRRLQAALAGHAAAGPVDAAQAMEQRRAAQVAADVRDLQVLELRVRMNAVNLAAQPVLAKSSPLDDQRIALMTSWTQLPRQRADIEWDYAHIVIAGEPAFTDAASRREADFWFNDILRQDSVKARLALTQRIVQGRITDAEAATLINHVMTRVAPRYAREAPLTPNEAVTRAAATLHRMHRDEDLTRLILGWVAQENDPTCLAVLGDLALEKHQPAAAAAFYQQAAAINLTDAALMYRTGVALSRAGAPTRDAGEQLKRLAPLLVLSDVSAATRLADAMQRFGTPGEGERWLDDYLVRFGRLSPEDLAAKYERARAAAESRGDLPAALDAQKAVLLCASTGSADDLVEIMAQVATYHRLRALDALARKDFATLADALEQHLNNGPPDVALLEKTLPALKNANHAAAEKILAAAQGRLLAVTEDYPDITTYRTELARLRALH